MDDFDFDEHGIYRERQQRRTSSDGLVLDDDGIWRDDGDVLSHYTLRTDSGLGTADRKSSSSTLNKLHVGETESGLLDHVDLQPPEDDDIDYHDDSYPLEEKSLNISELEASDTASFDNDSLGSAGDLDLPELNDSDPGTDELAARYRQEGLAYGFRNHHLQRMQERIDDTFDSELGLDFSSINDPSFLDASHDQSHSKNLGQSSNGNRHRNEETFDDMDDSLFGDNQHDDSISHLTRARDQDGIHRNMRRNQNSATGRSSRDQHKMASGIELAPPIQMGDSLFTQEDSTQVIYPQHSLIEFEELENYLGGGVQEDDQMDLIGAYLQGIKDQEETEDEEDGFEAVFNNNKQEDGILSARTVKRNQLPEERSNISEDEVIDEPYQRYKNDGAFIDVADSREGMSNFAVDETDGGAQVPELQPYGGGMQQFEELSLIENQLPPFSVLNSFNTDVDASRDVTKSHDFGSDVDHSWMKVQDSHDFQSDVRRSVNQDESGQSVEKPSKIPMLRSRSPSLSRPGSTNRSRPGSANLSRPPSASRSPTGSDTPTLMGSPERSRPRTRGETGRALPATPHRNDSVSSLSGHSSRSRSPSQGRSSQGGWSSGQSGSPTRRTSKRSLPVIQRSVSPSPVRSNSRYASSDSNHSHTADDLDSAASLLIEKEITTPTKTKPPNKVKSPLDKLKGRPRPASADTSRSNLPKDLKPKISSSRPSTPSRFRIRSNSAANIRTHQPLKATIAAVAGASPQEMFQRSKSFDADTEEPGQNDEVLKQLQQEYNTLLQKYALAENTIDSLRIGAKIPVTVDVTTNAVGGVSPGTPLGGSQHGGTTPSKATGSATSLSAVGGTAGAGSRPPSSMSQHSANTWNAQGGRTSVPPTVGAPSTTDEGIGSELSTIVGGDGMKLSILAKSKTVEDQMNALRILLVENHLSVDDQDCALKNIKQSYDKLQQEYHDSKEQFGFLRRQGRLGSITSEAGFDDDKTMEGELYRLNMAIDALEDQVQENKKTYSAPRVPFQGAVKADHSIKVGSDSPDGKDANGTIGLSPNRPPSVGSTTGGPGEIDQKLHKLNKDYSQLMDRYRCLRQMRKTPERDQEINGLLQDLREIYEASPDHRKPALPPELEKQYDAVHGAWMPPEYLTADDDEERAFLEAGQLANETEDGSTAGTMLDSDVFVPAYGKEKAGNLDSRDTSRKGSDVSSSVLSSDMPRHKKTAAYKQNLAQQYRQNAIPPTPPEGYSSTTDSAMSQPFRKPLGSPHPARLQQTPHRRREREDKDSGYVGSEASRQISGQDQPRDRYSSRGQQRRGSQRDERSGSQHSVNETDSVSNGSTVERVKTRRATPPNGKGSAKMSKQQLNSVPSRHSPHATKTDAGLVSGARPGGHGSKSIKAGPSSRGHSLSSDSDTDSDVISLPSRVNTARSGKNDGKSMQIKNLQDEVKRLKDEMQKATPGAQEAQVLQQPVLQQVVPQVNPTAAATYGQHGYYYPQDPSASNPYYNYYAYPQDGSNAYAQQNGYAASPGGQPAYPTPGISDQYTARPASMPDIYAQSQQYYPEYDAQVPAYDHNYPQDRHARDYSPERGQRRNDYSNDNYYRSYKPGYRDDNRDSSRSHRGSRHKYNDDLHPGYHSDDDNRTDRLRDYYIPTKARDSPNRRSSRADSKYRSKSPSRNIYDKHQTHYRSGPDLGRPSGGWSGGPRSAPPPPSFRQIHPQRQSPHGQGHSPHIQGHPQGHIYHPQGQGAYQVPAQHHIQGQHPAPVSYAAKPTACPMCGGGGLHTHGEYVHQPAVAAGAPVIVTPSAGNVIQQPVGAVNREHNTASVASPLPGSFVLPNGQTQQALIPVQLLGMNPSSSMGNGSMASSKVRYYVREYGSEGEEKARSSKHRKSEKLHINKSTRHYRSGSGSDSEGSNHDEFNDSISSAMRTAKELKRMSRHMKSTLKDELSKSYRDSRGSNKY